MVQILINILYSGAIYFLVALSFMLVYNVTKFFNIAHAIILTLGAYLSLLFMDLNISLYLAILLSLLISGCIGLGFEAFIYYKLRRKSSHPFVLMISSLGIYVIFQNIISLIWGDATKSIRVNEIQPGLEFIGAYITKVQILSIIIIALISICAFVFINNTNLGKKIKAISSNESLASIYGINSKRSILITVALGSILAAIAGILVAYDSDMTPSMGFNLLLYGIVAMIIGGIGNIYGIIGGSLLLATAQHIGAYYIDTKWMDAITYIILILFLIWKPLGFSGKQLKKVEI